MSKFTDQDAVDKWHASGESDDRDMSCSGTIDEHICCAPGMRHQHDCDKCVPLGQFDEYDLYFCGQGGGQTVIARYGEDGEYRSGLEFGKTGADPVLAVAYHMARSRGLIE